MRLSKPILLTMGLAFVSAAPALGSPPLPAKLNQLAQEKLGKDFRITFTLQKNANVCGAVEDAYIGQVEMNSYQRGVGRDGNPAVTDRWVKLDKHYAVGVAELSQADARLFDSDQCME